MSEDETFVRAIVDNRGDETARLVYADWLDDRADPRGTYLRAEAEWARTGKKEKALRALAALLDPVWVARVSRPPVGICADKIAMRTDRAPATPADLDAAEERLKLELPAELRALLLNWNGARPAVNRPSQPRFRFELTEVEQFFSVPAVGKRRRAREDEPWDLVEATETLCDPDFAPHMTGGSTQLLADYVPLADGGDLGTYLTGVRGKVVGKVGFFFDLTHYFGDPDHLGVVFPSLGALLASMIAEAPEWFRFVRNGDRAELLAWLDAGGDVNARHPETRESLLYTAMMVDDVSLVRELLARGAKVDRDVRELADVLSGANGRKIRDAVTAGKPAPKKKGKK